MGAFTRRKATLACKVPVNLGKKCCAARFQVGIAEYVRVILNFIEGWTTAVRKNPRWIKIERKWSGAEMVRMSARVCFIVGNFQKFSLKLAARTRGFPPGTEEIMMKHRELYFFIHYSPPFIVSFSRFLAHDPLIFSSHAALGSIRSGAGHQFPAFVHFHRAILSLQEKPTFEIRTDKK